MLRGSLFMGRMLGGEFLYCLAEIRILFLECGEVVVQLIGLAAQFAGKLCSNT